MLWDIISQRFFISKCIVVVLNGLKFKETEYSFARRITTLEKSILSYENVLMLIDLQREKSITFHKQHKVRKKAYQNQYFYILSTIHIIVLTFIGLRSYSWDCISSIENVFRLRVKGKKFFCDFLQLIFSIFTISIGECRT